MEKKSRLFSIPLVCIPAPSRDPAAPPGLRFVPGFVDALDDVSSDAGDLGRIGQVESICQAVLHHLLQLFGDPMSVRLEFDGFRYAVTALRAAVQILLKFLCTRPLANQIPDTPCSCFQYPMIANVVFRSLGHIRCISFHRFRSGKNPSWLA